MNLSEGKSLAREAGDQAHTVWGRTGPQTLSFLHHALQQNEQRLTKHHIKPLSSLSQKSRMEWGEHQALAQTCQDAAGQGPWGK